MKYQYKCINDYTDKDYKKFYKSLNEIDKNKVDKIINDKKKKQVMLDRMMLKKYLRDINIDYESIVLQYNQYGKPYLNHLYFNISHSSDYVLVGINDDEIGVDIERIRHVDLKILKQFCTSKEEEYILSSNDLDKSFWTIYTLKEAYFKMYGLDLSRVKDIEFEINEDKAICLNDKDLNIYISNEIHNYIFSIIYK